MIYIMIYKIFAWINQNLKKNPFTMYMVKYYHQFMSFTLIVVHICTIQWKVHVEIFIIKYSKMKLLFKITWNLFTCAIILQAITICIINVKRFGFQMFDIAYM
jgi:hypothetical protein